MAMSDGGVWYTLRSNFMLAGYTGFDPRQCRTLAVAPFSKKKNSSPPLEQRTTDSHLAQIPKGTSAGGVWYPPKWSQCVLQLHGFDSPPVHELRSSGFFLILILIILLCARTNQRHLSRKERRQKSTGCDTPSEIITHCVLYVTEERGSTPHLSLLFPFYYDKIRFFTSSFVYPGLITVYMPY
jgi:hypothetical protein